MNKKQFKVVLPRSLSNTPGSFVQVGSGQIVHAAIANWYLKIKDCHVFMIH